MATKLGSWIGRAVLPRQRRRFARDERGATLVEFGLLALPFFAIVGAILETSVVFLSGQVLESAMQDVSRLIRTGQARNVNMTEASFRSDICSRVYGMFPNCESNLFVDVRTITNFAGASITPPVDFKNTTCADPCPWTRSQAYTSGSSSSIVLVQVYYKWPIILNLGGLNLADLPGNKRLLGASTVFRNEPF